MAEKIFLIPGYGEDYKAFRQLAPFLDRFELIPVDYREVLGKLSLWEVSSRKLAKIIASHYGIREEDKLVGHSMGGYISYQLREIQGNDICMIGSFSDPGKIMHMIPQAPIMTTVFAGSGFSKTELAKEYLRKRVAGRAFEQPMMEVVENFKNFRNEELLKLSLLTLEKKRPSGQENPLRIHADDDRTVKVPDEPYQKVDGGHFCLNLHPGQVFDAMQTFVNP
jgi:hypothetical protein